MDIFKMSTSNSQTSNFSSNVSSISSRLELKLSSDLILRNQTAPTTLSQGTIKEICKIPEKNRYSRPAVHAAARLCYVNRFFGIKKYPCRLTLCTNCQLGKGRLMAKHYATSNDEHSTRSNKNSKQDKVKRVGDRQGPYKANRKSRKSKKTQQIKSHNTGKSKRNNRVSQEKQ